MGCQTGGRGIGRRLILLVDTDNGDRMRARQERGGIAHGARGQAAAVPRYTDVPWLHGAPVRIRDEQDGTSSLKKDLDRNDIVERIVVWIWLQHDSQIMEPRQTGDGCDSFERSARQRLKVIGNSSVA